MSDESKHERPADFENVKEVANLANRVALGQAVKHVTTAVTGNPLAGEMLGQAANTGYSLVPPEVKIGAGAGGLLVVHAGTHIISVGTAGSIAYGSAVLATALLPAIAIGAGIGGAFWLIRQLSK